jgi:hypothetical protein
VSCWYWLPQGERGEIAITVGYHEEFLREIYRDVRPAGTFSHPYAMPWENDQLICVLPGPDPPLA